MRHYVLGGMVHGLLDDTVKPPIFYPFDYSTVSKEIDKFLDDFYSGKVSIEFEELKIETY